MKIEAMRTLIFVLPLLSLLVASGIVRHQYARQERLKRELAQTEREMARLVKRLPNHVSLPMDACDDPKHAEHHHGDNQQ